MVLSAWYNSLKQSLWKRLVLYLVLLLLLIGAGYSFMFRMPGNTFTGPLPPLTEHEASVRDALRRDVEMLATQIGERNVGHPQQLAQAAYYLAQSFTEMGYPVQRQAYVVDNVTCENIIAEKAGSTRPEEIVVIGGHYDSVFGTVGANDNGSGAAAVLAIARRFRDLQPARTVRFVEFVNEEPPYFTGDLMGSMVYAKACKARGDRITSMISLETIGYYSDEEGSQQYPPLVNFFYPSTGNFIAIVGNVPSRGLVRDIVKTFRETTNFPSEGGVFPEGVPGVGWSDHRSFWKVGYPAAMVTDTAPFRYPYYHKPSDTPEKINYDAMSRVVVGFEHVTAHLAGMDRL